MSEYVWSQVMVSPMSEKELYFYLSKFRQLKHVNFMTKRPEFPKATVEAAVELLPPDVRTLRLGSAHVDCTRFTHLEHLISDMDSESLDKLPTANTITQLGLGRKFTDVASLYRYENLVSLACGFVWNDHPSLGPKLRTIVTQSGAGRVDEPTWSAFVESHPHLTYLDWGFGAHIPDWEGAPAFSSLTYMSASLRSEAAVARNIRACPSFRALLVDVLTPPVIEAMIETNTVRELRTRTFGTLISVTYGGWLDVDWTRGVPDELLERFSEACEFEVFDLDSSPKDRVLRILAGTLVRPRTIVSAFLSNTGIDTLGSRLEFVTTFEMYGGTLSAESCRTIGKYMHRLRKLKVDLWDAECVEALAPACTSLTKLIVHVLDGCPHSSIPNFMAAVSGCVTNVSFFGEHVREFGVMFLALSPPRRIQWLYVQGGSVSGEIEEFERRGGLVGYTDYPSRVL